MGRVHPAGRACARLRAVDRCIQTHGGMGLTNEVGLTAAWHQLRRIMIADGTAEILRRAIVKEMRAGDTGMAGDA